MTDYTKLYDHLTGLSIKNIKTWDTTYDTIENILGARLPPSARKYSAFWKWSKNHRETGGVRHVLQLAGWETREQSPNSNTLRFNCVA